MGSPGGDVTLLVDPSPSDEEIAARVFGGDVDALAVLYERYAHRVYDLALRVLRDPDAAEDVVQATYINAWKHLKKRKVEGNIRAWLMSIARNAAIDAVRSRKRLERLGTAPIETIEYTALAHAPDIDPEEMAHRREVADLVWEAASSLTPSEYSLLDLHLRQGFDAADLAHHLGARKGSVHVRLLRMRNSLRRSVLASLLWRHPGNCHFVAQLKRASPHMKRGTRETLLKHAEACDRCREATQRFANPVEMFAGFSILAMPDPSRPTAWDSISTAIAVGGAAGASLLSALSERVSDLVSSGGRNVRGLVAAGTGSLAVAVIAIIVTVGAGDGADHDTPSLSPTTEPIATSAAATSPVPTAAP